MFLLSLNRSAARPIQIGKKTQQTGIFKAPVSGPLDLTPSGLSDDVQVNQKFHGGPDQAIYLYAMDDYFWWGEQLGRKLPAGSFGENLTVSTLPSLSIGDRVTIGPVVLEITAPRIPCATLAASLGMPDMVKRFTAAERLGCYARVLQPGSLEAGLPVAVEARGSFSVLEVFHLTLDPKADPDRLRVALQSPLAQRWRQIFEDRLKLT